MINLTFECREYYLKYYTDVLKIILKCEYSFKIYKKNSKKITYYFLEIYKNNLLQHRYFISKIENYNTFDYLISNFINKYIHDIYMFNDFYLFDDFTGEIIENNKNKYEYEKQLEILNQSSVYIPLPNFKKIVLLKAFDELIHVTTKNHIFKSKYLYQYNEFFCFQVTGIFNRKRQLRLKISDIQNCYKDIYNIEKEYNLDYAVILIKEKNLSYNLMRNPLRVNENIY